MSCVSFILDQYSNQNSNKYSGKKITNMKSFLPHAINFIVDELVAGKQINQEIANTCFTEIKQRYSQKITSCMHSNKTDFLSGRITQQQGDENLKKIEIDCETLVNLIKQNIK